MGDVEGGEIARRIHHNICGCRDARCRTREGLNAVASLVARDFSAHVAAARAEERERGVAEVRALADEFEQLGLYWAAFRLRALPVNPYREDDLRPREGA